MLHFLHSPFLFLVERGIGLLHCLQWFFVLWCCLFGVLYIFWFSMVVHFLRYCFSFLIRYLYRFVLSKIGSIAIVAIRYTIIASVMLGSLFVLVLLVFLSSSFVFRIF